MLGDRGEDAGWARPGPTPGQRRADLAVAPLLALGAVASLMLMRSVVTPPSAAGTAEQVAWYVAMALPLAVRRSHPVVALLLCTAAFTGIDLRGINEGLMTSICLFAAIYSVGAWERDRRLAVASRALTDVVIACLLVVAFAEGVDLGDAAGGSGPLPAALAAVLYSAAVNVLFLVAAHVFGDRALRAAHRRELLERRNAELAAARDGEARRAVLAERVRIARELHDVVAHHVGLLGIRAAAARRVMERDPDLARRTLLEAEDTGRAATAEMRRMLGALREDGADAVPAVPAGVADLPALVSGAATGSLATRFTEVGDPAPVPAGVGSVLYRVVQEALTNTVRHAAARTVDVRLRHLPGAVEVEVVDDGTGPAPGAAPGLGTLGMRERVALHGGVLEAGARPGGGYRVRARLPLSPDVPGVVDVRDRAGEGAA